MVFSSDKTTRKRSQVRSKGQPMLCVCVYIEINSIDLGKEKEREIVRGREGDSEREREILRDSEREGGDGFRLILVLTLKTNYTSGI